MDIVHILETPWETSSLGPLHRNPQTDTLNIIYKVVPLRHI